MKAQTKKILLLLLPILIFGAYLMVRHLTWKAQGIKSWDTQHKLEATWASNSFNLRVDDTNFVTAISSRIMEQQQLLDTNKAAALAKELNKMLAAFGTGSSEAFAEFRFPTVNTKEITVKWNEDLVKFEKEALQFHNITPKTTGETFLDNVALARQFFDWSSGLTNEAGLKRYCTSCWAGIATDTLKVMPLESPSGSVDLMNLVQSEGNINFTHGLQLITYEPKRVSKANLFAKVGLTVQTDGKLKAYRVYISFYWDPESEQWIPQNILLPFVGNEAETIYY